MWIFDSPRIIFGEGALSYLAQLRGRRAFIVTDPVMVKLGFVDLVREQLHLAGFETHTFSETEPEPSLETVQEGAKRMREYQPDWIVGLGGGSPMDAAKAMWVLYERPDLQPEAINPLEELGIGQKAKLVTIPTTSGTGAEATWAVVLTDKKAKRKLGIGSRENLATVAIVDPVFTTKLPPQIIADTGLDALVHAVEGYTGTWHNDFSDGLCIKAIQLIFKYLPRSYSDAGDEEARAEMHNAASIAGLGFINSLCSLAHAMAHSFGAAFEQPHGRCTALFLPYTMEFAVKEGGPRYADIARSLGLAGPDTEEQTAAWAFIDAVRNLESAVRTPTCAKDMNFSHDAYEMAMESLIDFAQNDTQIVTAPRVPEREELEKLFWYVYEGKRVDF